MVREKLSEASDNLREAAIEGKAEFEERLYERSDELANLAAADDGPDHGRLARITHALEDLAEDVEEETREHVQQAKEKVKEYRENVEGV
jgi:gas vesicle protein